jgi:hypothetical protein
MIDRPRLRDRICNSLQQRYVALFGQYGSGMEQVIRSIVGERPTVPSMKFVQVPLPRYIEDIREFKQAFLDSLIDTAARIPPRGAVARAVERALQDRKPRTVEPRLRLVLDTLSRDTSARPLVFVLTSLAEVPTIPLKALLVMLRDYHDQIDIPNSPGSRLRILAAGDARLWDLCCHKVPNVSPFNIAERHFLDGLSLGELRELDPGLSFESALQLRDLTDGVPALVDIARVETGQTGDLSHYFGPIQDQWNSLSALTQESLIAWSQELGSISDCIPDYKCPQIPGSPCTGEGRLLGRIPPNEASPSHLAISDPSRVCDAIC